MPLAQTDPTAASETLGGREQRPVFHPVRWGDLSLQVLDLIISGGSSQGSRPARVMGPLWPPPPLARPDDPALCLYCPCFCTFAFVHTRQDKVTTTMDGPRSRSITRTLMLP